MAEEISNEELDQANQPGADPSDEAAAESDSASAKAALKEAAAAEAPHVRDDPNQKWYVVHVNSGHEYKVAATLKEHVTAADLATRITDILIPTQDKIVIAEGKKRTIKDRIFPGYILVKMSLSDLTWHTVRNTSGVTGFVGTGGKPTPLPEKEVESIIKFTALEAPKFEAKYSLGDGVKIIDGPFTDFIGKVEALDEEKGKVKVLVSIFGRETPVELDFLQVSPL